MIATVAIIHRTGSKVSFRIYPLNGESEAQFQERVAREEVIYAHRLAQIG